MRRSKPILMLLVSVAVGLVATAAAAKYLNNKAGDPADKPKPTKKFVVIAKGKIAEGKEIVATDIKKEERPIGELPDDVIENTDLVVGRKALVKIDKDDVISETKLVAEEVVYRASPGMREYSLYRAVVPARLEPGMHVDVIALGEGKDAEEDQGDSTPERGIILEYVKVLEVPPPGSRTRNALKATLEVSAEDAVKLATAVEQGTVTLIINRETSRPEPRKRVLVAAQFIHKGKLISESDLTVTRMPVAHVPEYAVVKKSAVIGLEATAAIKKGGVIVAEKLRKPDEVKNTAPLELLARARALKGAAAETRLTELIQQFPDDPAAEEAKNILKKIADERLRNAAKAEFEVAYKKIEAMVTSGAFEGAQQEIDRALEAYDGLKTADGDVVELLEGLRERADEREKKAGKLFNQFKNLKINGRNEIAEKYKKQLEAFCPQSRYTQMARNMML